MDVAKIISVLERAKHDHRDGGIEGLDSCPGYHYEHIEGCRWGFVEHPELCECGATAINAEIDELIIELTREAVAWNAE